MKKRACPNCSKRIAATATFCEHCGHRLQPVQPEQLDPEQTQPLQPEQLGPEQTQTLAQSRSKMVLLTVLAIAVIIPAMCINLPQRGAPSGGAATPTARSSSLSGIKTTKADYIACLTKPAMERVIELLRDRAAFGRYIADPSNGCVHLRPGLRVYVEDYSWGLIRIRPEGETADLWTVREAVD